MRRQWIFGLAMLLPCLSGCGAGNGEIVTEGTGRAALTVRWPERSRLVPVASESIRVTLAKGNSLLAERLLTRPISGNTTSAEFDRLPVGDVMFRASALPNSDGSGVAQAGAESVVPIVAGQVAPVRLTMASAIDRIEVTPRAPTVAIGQAAQLVATAKNTAGEVVLTKLSTFEWSSANPAIATVDVVGVVTGVAIGSTSITAREIESGKAGTVVVAISTASSGNVKCNPANNHCYERVELTNQISWTAARDAAATRSYMGRSGHLVTVTSADETNYLVANFTSLAGIYLGGYQDRNASDYSEPRGAFRWITGEAFNYTNWIPGEPNNQGDSFFAEDYIQFSHLSSTGQWNDIGYQHPTDAPRAYIVEYDP